VRDDRRTGRHTVYPNPVNDVITLRTDVEVLFHRVEICDLQDRWLMAVKDKMHIERAHLPPGMYILTAVSEDGVYGGKFVKSEK